MVALQEVQNGGKQVKAPIITKKPHPATTVGLRDTTPGRISGCEFPCSAIPWLESQPTASLSVGRRTPVPAHPLQRGS